MGIIEGIVEYGSWIVAVVFMIAAVLVFIGWRKGEKIKSDRIEALVASNKPVFFKIVNYGKEDFYCIDFEETMKDPAVMGLKQFESIKAKIEMIQIDDKPS